jgi:hypothetical protein
MEFYLHPLRFDRFGRDLCGATKLKDPIFNKYFCISIKDEQWKGMRLVLSIKVT